MKKIVAILGFLGLVAVMLGQGIKISQLPRTSTADKTDLLILTRTNASPSTNLAISVSDLIPLNNLKWWGAKGDGVTDDSASISNWLNWIKQGVVGHVPPGLYRTRAQDCTSPSLADSGYAPHPSYCIVGDSFPSYPAFRPIYNHITTNATFVGIEDGPPMFDFTGGKGTKLENIVFTTEGTNRPECAVLFGRHGTNDGSSGYQDFRYCAFSGEYRIASMINLAADFATYYKCLWYSGMPWSKDQQVGFYSAFQTNTVVKINGITNCIWSKFRPFTNGVCMGGMSLNKWDQCTWYNESTNQGISMVLEASQGIIENGFFGVSGGSTNNIQLGFNGGPLEFRHCSIEGWGTNQMPNFLEFKTGGGIFQDISIRNCLLMAPIYGEDNTTVTGLKIENNAWWPTGTNMNLAILRNSYIQGGGYPQDGSAYLSESGTNVGTWVIRGIADNNTWVNVWPTNVLGTEQHNSSFITPNSDFYVNGIFSKTVYSPRYIGTTPYIETPISSEMLTNGDCSTTNGWWTTLGLGNSIIAVAGGVVGNCLLVTNGVTAQGGVAEQNLITEIGGTYKVSGYGRIDGTNTFGWTISVGTNGGNGIDMLLCPIQKSTNWTLITGIFDAISTDPLLQLRPWDTNSTAHAYFDSISVVRIPGGNVMARGLFTGDGGTNGVKITSGGKVGIGTNSPQSLIDIQGATNPVIFRVGTRAISNGSNSLCVNTNGCVGIGTPDPLFPLHVLGWTYVQSGGITSDIQVQAPKILMGSGTATGGAKWMNDGNSVVLHSGDEAFYATNNLVVPGSIISSNMFVAVSGVFYPTNSTVPSTVTAANLGIGGHWVGNSNGFLVDIYSLDGATTAMKVLAP